MASSGVLWRVRSSRATGGGRWEGAALAEVWHGWVNVGGPPNLEFANGFEWYEPYARDTVSSYPWAVLASPAARQKLNPALIAQMPFPVQVRELAGRSAGAAFYVADRAPAAMSDLELRAWRRLLHPALAAVVNPVAHNLWVNRDLPFWRCGRRLATVVTRPARWRR